MQSVASTIDVLRSTSSQVVKIAALQRNDSEMLREVLKATYDPFRKYGINSAIWPKSYGSKTLGDIWPQVVRVLDALAVGHGSHMLKATVASIMEGLYRGEADLLMCIIRKDLKAGLAATTVNKAFPDLIPVFGIMKAATFKDNLWRPNLMGSIKLDGYRCVAQDGLLLSSGGHVIVGADHILEELDKVGDCDFDGEIMVPNMNFQESGGAIRSAKITPDAKLFLFDRTEDPTLPFKQRYALLEEVARAQNWSFSLANPGTITVVRHRTFSGVEEMYSTFNKALAGGYEGLVLKDPEGKYELKRSKAWLKVKNTLDEDCKIVGFYEGEGKYEHVLGGVYAQRENGYRSKVGGGFSDTQRYAIWQDQGFYANKTIEVHYMEDTPDGDFRHARFKKFRPDKD